MAKTKLNTKQTKTWYLDHKRHLIEFLDTDVSCYCFLCHTIIMKQECVKFDKRYYGVKVRVLLE